MGGEDGADGDGGTAAGAAVDASLLEDRLSAVAVLQAMYPLPSELVLSHSTLSAIDALTADPLAAPGCDALELVLTLTTPRGPVALAVRLPFSAAPDIAVRQPDFLSRAQHAGVAAALPAPEPDQPAADYVLAVVDCVAALVDEVGAGEGAAEETEDVAEPREEALERVWFWFPSLSTREKRQDLVDYAPRYGLTGFVLAGKPGLLCLEGAPRAVDRYMAAIKSESWSDIPPHQKKVTERLRVRLDAGPSAPRSPAAPVAPVGPGAPATSSSAGRRFTDMREITHLVPQHGQYGHRGDMGEVRRLMDAWGVGDDFGAVVMGA